MKKYVLILFVLLIVLTSCSQKGSMDALNSKNPDTADKAFEQGKLALANEDFNKAKNNFELAYEEDKKSEAKVYLNTIDLIESFNSSYEQDELKEAKKIQIQLLEDTNYTKFYFMLDENADDLDLIMNIREDIDEQIEGLKEHFDPDKGNMPSELYLAESQEILDEYYISTEQLNDIYEWREAAKVVADAEMERQIERELKVYD